MNTGIDFSEIRNLWSISFMKLKCHLEFSITLECKWTSSSWYYIICDMTELDCGRMLTSVLVFNGYQQISYLNLDII